MKLLTYDERDALQVLANFSGIMRCIIGDGPCASGDWNEAAAHIHALQASIMSQAAARAFPSEYRLLGGHYASSVPSRSEMFRVDL